LVSLEAWDRCGDPDLELENLRNCEIWGGVDLSSTTDLSSIGIIIKAPNGNWVIQSWCWLAGTSLSECERRDRLQYSKYIADELLYFDEQPTIQFESILNFFKQLKPTFPKLKIVGFDPYLGDQLRPIDKNFVLCPIAQQFKFMSPAIKFLKTKILEGKLQHDGNGLLRAMVESARVVEDGEGNLKLSKVKSASRIDGLISIVIAIAAMINEEVVNK
jgi:phage terminase large subunit-like protein